MLVFEERGKPEYPEKNLSEQRREPTTNSTHIWRRVRESNPAIEPGTHWWEVSALTTAPSLLPWFVTKSNKPKSHAYKCYLHYSINPWQLLYRLQHAANQQSFPCCWSGQHLISYVLSKWTWFWEKKEEEKRKNFNNFAYAFNLKKFQMQCLFASD